MSLTGCDPRGKTTKRRPSRSQEVGPPVYSSPETVQTGYIAGFERCHLEYCSHLITNNYFKPAITKSYYTSRSRLRFQLHLKILHHQIAKSHRA